jgi:DNA mismatch repair protein MutS
MALDAVSLRHLEILEPLHRDAPRQASLYGALNRTVTPMGARRLRDWLSQPLAARGPIARRRRRCSLGGERRALDDFRRELAEVRDLERTIGRLSAGSGNAPRFGGVALALEKIPGLKGILARRGAEGRAAGAAGIGPVIRRKRFAERAAARVAG